MLKRYDPARTRSLYVAASDAPAEVAKWITRELGGELTKKSAPLVISAGTKSGLAFTLTPRKKGGDEVSMTLLGTCTFFREPRIAKKAGPRVERLCQRIFDTQMLIGCVSEEELSAADLKTIGKLAEELRALVFDGSSMRDWTGRLVVDTSAKTDEAALAPIWHVLSSTEALPSAPATKATAKHHAAVAAKDFRFEKAFERHLEFLGLQHSSPQAAARAKQLKAFYKKAKHRLPLVAQTAKSRLDLAATEIATDLPVVSSDGWSFFDSEGHLLLDRDGKFDAKAEVPAL